MTESGAGLEAGRAPAGDAETDAQGDGDRADPADTPIDVVHNPEANRFEAIVDGAQSVAEYRRRGNDILFTHTEVPPSLEGQGIGHALARAALDYSREEGLAVIPRCRFISAYIRRHPEYQDLVKSDST